MSLNCRSLRSKTSLLQDIIEDNHIDIVALQETWLTPGDAAIYAELREQRFKVLKLERSNKKGGGLAVMVKSNITNTIKTQYVTTYDGFESIFCTFSIGKMKIILVNVYRPPAKSKSEFLLQFEDYLATVLENDGLLLIFGDFNIDLLLNEPITNRFLKILERHGLMQLRKKPTRGKALLDLIISQTTNTDILETFHVDEEFPSDHLPLFLKYNESVERVNRSVKRDVRDFSLLDSDTFAKELMSSQLVNTHSVRDLTSSEYVDLYNTTISKILDAYCPLKTKVFNRDKTQRWYDADLQKLKQDKRKAKRKYNKSPSEDLYKVFQKARNKYTSNLKKTRRKYFANQIETNKGDSKVLFRTLNELTGTNKEKVLPSTGSESKVCEEMSEFFLNKVLTIREDIKIKQTSNNTAMIAGVNDSKLAGTASLPSFKKINICELKRLLSNIKKKSCKLDPAPTSFLMENSDLLYPVFCAIINTSIEECAFPKPLKNAIITPILKSASADVNNYKNYRPVSSLPFLSKIIEKAIYDQINDYVESNELHPTFQSAYRNRFSCETALSRIYNDIHNVLYEGKSCVLVLLDSSAAFDTVDHNLLLKKLECDFNIKDNALKFIESYLADRSFTTLVNTTESSKKRLLYGVPQGSLLGPLLYIMYTKGLEELILSYGLRLHMYADDIQIYFSCSTDKLNNVEHVLQTCLAGIQTWMDDNFLKLNSDKTQIKVFPAKLSDPRISTLLNLECNDSVKVLGVAMSGLKLHTFISNKVRVCQYHLRNFNNIKHSLDTVNRTLLVTNIILSTLDYCNILLLGATDKDLKPLCLTLNRAVRFILNVKFRDHITPYYKRLHFLPIEQRIKFKACLFGYKIFYRIMPSYILENFSRFTPNLAM